MIPIKRSFFKVSFLFFFFVLFCWIESAAQNPRSNLQKYWNYRARFLGEDGGAGFISLGTEPGQSIPMSGRNPIANCESDWWLQNAECKRRKGKGKVEWGDATVYQGFYIATLALEYRNLKDADQDVTATSEELYLALKAYERLDRAGEERLGYKPVLDGWFIRDDVPSGFYLDKGTRRFKQYECVQSAYGCGTKTSGDGSFVSQDQVLALLMGFAFVKELIGEEVPKKSRQNFGEIAALYTDKIITYMMKNNWRLVGPDGEKVPNRWGGDLRAFNHIMVKTGDRICAGKYAPYSKKAKVGMGKFLGGTFNWAYGVQNKRNHHMIFEGIITAKMWNLKKITKRSRRTDQIAFALAYAALNDKENVNKYIDRKKDVESLLNLAPRHGTCYGTPGCNAPDGWKSTDRWWHPGHVNGNPYNVKMEWSGLDYMFFYNLYHYLYKSDLPHYKKPRF